MVNSLLPSSPAKLLRTRRKLRLGSKSAELCKAKARRRASNSQF